LPQKGAKRAKNYGAILRAFSRLFVAKLTREIFVAQLFSESAGCGTGRFRGVAENEVPRTRNLDKG
jgi:hypothetical protein